MSPMISRALLSVALVALATLKIVHPVEVPDRVHSLATLLRQPSAQGVAIAVELLLAAGLVSPWHRFATVPLILWLASLLGLSSAAEMNLIQGGDCGCLGSLPFTSSQRIASLSGLLLLTIVFVRTKCRTGSRPQTELSAP